MISNANIIFEYSNEKDEIDLLNKAVEFYSKEYIKGEFIYQNKKEESNLIGINFNNNKFVIDNSFLNSENTKVSNDIVAYRLKKDFIFQREVNNFNIKHKIYFAFNVKSDDTFENIFEIDTNIEISKQLEKYKNPEYYFYVFEEDESFQIKKTKNNAKYILYYDNNKPFLKAQISYDDKEDEDLIINAYDKRTDVLNKSNLYFNSFKIISFNDKEDKDMVLLKIKGKNYNKTYFTHDINNIPTLSNENSLSGKFEIEIYDRNYNMLKFEVHILTKKLELSIENKEDEKSPIIINIKNEDNYNKLHNIKIVKLYIENSKTLKYSEKEVSLNKLETNKILSSYSYQINEGGNYKIYYEDLYKNKYESDIIVFNKGLPEISLEGVQKNASTTNDVQINFHIDKEIYIIEKNNKTNTIKQINVDAKYISNDLKTILIKSVKDLTDCTYKVIIVDREQREKYSEVEFKIKATLTGYIIKTVSNKMIYANNVISEDFIVEINDKNILYEIKKDGTLIENGNNLFSLNGEYKIKIFDNIGNEKIFEIIIDKNINYTLKGNFVKISEHEIFGSNITLKINEEIDFIMINNNKSEILKEYNFIIEGKYNIVIRDKNQNQISLNITIDKSEPKFEIKGVENKGTTSNIVFILTDNDNIINIKRNGVTLTKKSLIFEEEGLYEVEIINKIKNKVNLFFEIDKSVNYETNMNFDSQITTEDIKIKSIEKEKPIIKINGKQIKESEILIKEYGEYQIEIEDKYKNKKILNYTKIPLRSNLYKFNLPNGQIIKKILLDDKDIEIKNLNLKENGIYFITIENIEDKKTYNLNIELYNKKPEIDIIKNKNNTVTILKNNNKNLKYFLYKDDKKTNFKNNISEKGKYKLKIEDELGNTNEYNFSIKKKMKIQNIAIISGSVIIFLLFLILIYKKRKNVSKKKK